MCTNEIKDGREVLLKPRKKGGKRPEFLVYICIVHIS